MTTLHIPPHHMQWSTIRKQTCSYLRLFLYKYNVDIPAQSLSSLPSPQSLSVSHSQVAGIQLPLSQVNWLSVHTIANRMSQTMINIHVYPQTHNQFNLLQLASSLLSEQSLKPSHSQEAGIHSPSGHSYSHAGN